MTATKFDRQGAILRLIDNPLAVRSPGNANNQEIGWLIFICVDPVCGAAAGTDDAELYYWIRISGFWIGRDFHFLVIGYVVYDGKLWNRTFIDAQISEHR